MQFRVIYPDREAAVVNGKEVVVSIDEGKFSVNITPLKKGEKTHSIDSRAVVVSNLGIEYTPRSYIEKMDKGTKEWLAINKDWPLVLFLPRY